MNKKPSKQSFDKFRVVLILFGILLASIVLIREFLLIDSGINIIIFSIGTALILTFITVVTANRIAVGAGREPIAKIFISFSYRDKEFVDKLSNEITQRGFEILRADEALLVGDLISEKIFSLMAISNFFIVVISNNSISSENVLAEVNYALLTRKRLFPVVIEKIEQRHIPEFLENRYVVDFTQGFNQALKKLIITLEESVEN